MTYCGYFCDVSARDAETKDNLLTAGQNGLNIMRGNLYSFRSKVIHVLLGFACPILYVTISILLGKQMPPDLPMLPAFLIETED